MGPDFNVGGACLRGGPSLLDGRRPSWMICKLTLMFSVLCSVLLLSSRALDFLGI